MSTATQNINIDEFYANYEGNTSKLLDLMFRYKLIKKDANCHTCNVPIKITVRQNGDLLFRCHRTSVRKKKKWRCNFKLSARSGTFMQGSKINFPHLLKFFIYWCYMPNPQFMTLHRILKVSKKTIVEWSEFCRNVCFVYLQQSTQKLGGRAKIVDVDIYETELNTNPWMLGMSERDSNKIFVVPISEVSEIDYLMVILEEHILPGTTVVSESWNGFNSIPHLELREPLHFIPPDGECHKKNMAKLWKAFYRGIPTWGRSHSYMEGYISEFMFKHRFDLEQRFDVFLKAVAFVHPPNY